MGRAKRAIEALAELALATATVRRDGATLSVPVEELVVGDIIVVKPDERMPADGYVMVGESSVNQAPVTGESVPVDKRPISQKPGTDADFGKVAAEHRVFAGTINGPGALKSQSRDLQRTQRFRAWFAWSQRQRLSVRQRSTSRIGSSAFSCPACSHWLSR